MNGNTALVDTLTDDLTDGKCAAKVYVIVLYLGSHMSNAL